MISVFKTNTNSSRTIICTVIIKSLKYHQSKNFGRDLLRYRIKPARRY